MVTTADQNAISTFLTPSIHNHDIILTITFYRRLLKPYFPHISDIIFFYKHKLIAMGYCIKYPYPPVEDFLEFLEAVHSSRIPRKSSSPSRIPRKGISPLKNSLKKQFTRQEFLEKAVHPLRIPRKGISPLKNSLKKQLTSRIPRRILPFPQPNPEEFHCSSTGGGGRIFNAISQHMTPL